MNNETPVDRASFNTNKIAQAERTIATVKEQVAADPDLAYKISGPLLRKRVEISRVTTTD